MARSLIMGYSSEFKVAMDIGNMLNTKNAAAAAAAEAQLQQHLAHAAHMRGPLSLGPDHTANGQHGGPHLYHPHPGQPLHPMTNLPNSMKYDQSSQSPHGIQLMPNGYMSSTQENSYHQNDTSSNRSSSDTTPKVFVCSTCTKGFARRSDLARHERIHSGERPHVCDTCGKSFIQRSALTVHTRVHTGIKPHTCGTCGKAFSDSSSLARHRRIHLGLRPFKCPFANCQKTFTRRTTLTRHQSSHTGTTEEAEAETNAKLATADMRSQRHSDGSFSENASTHSTPSPGQRTHSISPGHELPPIPNMHRQTSDYGYMPNGSLPPHLRSDFQQNSPRASPGLTSSALSGYGSSNARPSMTSHPNTYGPPQPLEPPATTDHRSGGSAGGSPHMNAVGWNSPPQPGMPSPGPIESYGYPDTTYGGGHPLYFSGSNFRQPQSTEPDHYDMKSRHLAPEWNSLPVMH